MNCKFIYKSSKYCSLEICEKLLKQARDALYSLSKDEDRGITEDEQWLVFEIDNYFGVATLENEGKRDFRLSDTND